MKKTTIITLSAILVIAIVIPSHAAKTTRTEPLVKTVMSGMAGGKISESSGGTGSAGSAGLQGSVPGISYSVTEDGAGRYADIDQTFRTVLARPGKRFVKWFQLEDRFGVKGFHGSIALKAKGSRGVTGIMVRARGTGEEDKFQKIHKIRDGKPGAEILDFTSKDGIRYRVSVNPDSANGKTFDVKVTGRVRL